MYSCKSNYSLLDEEKEEILSSLILVNMLFLPEEEVIILNSRTGEWVYYDGSGTVVSDSIRNTMLNIKLEQLKNNKITTKRFVEQVYNTISERSSVNLGVALTGNSYGDVMVKVLPNRIDVYREYCDDWLGDEEILEMLDSTFHSFLKSRLISVSESKAVMELPYSEQSVVLCEQVERESLQYEFCFSKDSENKWLLDDIKIVERKK